MLKNCFDDQLLIDMECGSCFIKDDQFFIKTTMESSNYTPMRVLCVNISNGTVEYFDKYINVIPCKIEYYVTRRKK